MSDRHPSPPPFLPRLAAVMLFGISTGAVAAAPHASDAMPVQMASSGVIAPSAAFIEDAARPAARQGFQPAPMPDQDADAPSTYVPRGPELTPALFSHKAEFAGDGYAPASDPDHGLDNRRTPAAGLNWSVPVK